MTARTLRRLHRWVGLTAALFVLLFSISGIALNHTDSLRLDERVVGWAPVAALYGIRPPPVERAWPTGAGVFIAAGGRLFLEGMELPAELRATPVGAVAVDGMLAVATPSELLLFGTDQGLLIDAVRAVHGLPVPVSALGRHQGALALRSVEQWYLADESLLEWTPVTGIRAAEPVAPSAAQAARVRQMIGAPGPTLERFLLDLHSGRLPGPLGVVLADLMALALVFLAATGIWVALRHR